MTLHAADSHGAELRTDVAAFYDRSIREVYRYFHRATAGNRQLTEDLTQETFMACMRAARDGVADATTMPWLMGVAKHKLIDYYRRRTREGRNLSLVWNARTEDVTAGNFDVTDAEALGALAQLSEQHRLVLVLRYVNDLPVSEVAEAVGRSVRATESLIVRARHALEQIFKEQNDV